MKWKKYITDVFLYRYTNPSFFIKKKKKVKDWPSLIRKRRKYYGYYFDRVFIDYRLPDDDDERFSPIPKSKHRALKLLFTFSSAKCVDEQQRVITGVAGRFFQDWTELWYARIGANSYLRHGKGINRNFSNFSLVGAFARFFSTLYSSQVGVSRKFLHLGKDMKELEADYPFYERSLDNFDLSEQKFFYLKDSGDWVHSAWVSKPQLFGSWFIARGSGSVNLAGLNWPNTSFEKLGLLIASGLSDRRLSDGLSFNVCLESLFVGGYGHMDLYTGASAYIRFIILTNKGLELSRGFNFSLCNNIRVLRRLGSVPVVRPVDTFERRRFFRFLRYKHMLLITKWVPLHLFNSLIVLEPNVHIFLFRLWKNYFGLSNSVSSGEMMYSHLSPLSHFNDLLHFDFRFISFNSFFSGVFFPILSASGSVLKKLLFIKEGVVPLSLSFFALLGYTAPFFAARSSSNWGILLYDAVELTHRRLVLQFLNLVPSVSGATGGVYSLIRAFLWAYFIKEFSERAEFDNCSLNITSSTLKLRHEFLLFNSAKFVSTNINTRSLRTLLDLSRSMLSRIGLLTFLTNSVLVLGTVDAFWVKRFYAGQLNDYVTRLLLKTESLFFDGGAYRDDFRILLFRVFKTSSTVNRFVPAVDFWTTLSINNSPPTSFLKFNSGPTNILRFAQIGAGAFHHQFFLLLSLPLSSDVATRSVRHFLPTTLPKAISSLDNEFLFFDRISQDFLLRGISKNARSSLNLNLALGYSDAQTFFFDNYVKLGFFNNFDTILYDRYSQVPRGGVDSSQKFLKLFYNSTVRLSRVYTFDYRDRTVGLRRNDVVSTTDAEIVRVWVGYELLYC